MIRKIFIVCLIGLLSACNDEPPLKYLTITQPTEATILNVDQLLIIQGTGQSLYENNVVIEIEDLAGTLLLQEPITMKTEQLGGAGEWKIEIELFRPIPTGLKIMARSPSPKTGETGISSQALILTVTKPLDTTRWRLQQAINTSGQLAPVLATTKIHAEFADNKINGSAGCNRYFGSYQYGKKMALSFPTPLVTTMMACPEDIANQEQRYLQALSSITHYKIEQKQLTLLNKDQQAILIFDYDPPVALENTKWQATGVNTDRGGVVSNKYTPLITAEFNNGKVSGNAGCNRFSSSYEINEKQLTFGPIATTKKYCTDEGIYVLEKQFLQAMEQTTTFEMNSEQLKLRNDNGSLMISFSPK